MSKRYDRAYFDRWYRDPTRRVISPAALARKIALVVAAAEYQLARPVRSVLDVGCGEGAWRAPLRKLRPAVRYVGVDASAYAAARFGRTRMVRLGALDSLGSVADAADGAPWDVIVCADVLQYLPDAEVAAGLAHVAALLGGLAYVEAFTVADALEGDRREWHARTAADYDRLFAAAGLVHLGMHCYVGEALVRTTTERERGRVTKGA